MFDHLQAKAKSSQMIVLYFMAILPSGEAVNVASQMMPEELEIIGPKLPISAPPNKELVDHVNKRKIRGERIAELMTKQLNPAIDTLLEEIIKRHLAS